MPDVEAYKAGFMDKCAELGIPKSAALPNLLLNLPLAALSIPQALSGASDVYHGVKDRSMKQTLGGAGNIALGGLGLAFGHHMAGQGLRDLGAGMKALKGAPTALSGYVAKGPIERYMAKAGPGRLSRWSRTAGGALMHPFWKADVAGMGALNKLKSAPAVADWAGRAGAHPSFNNPISRLSTGLPAVAAMLGLSPVADTLSQAGAADVQTRGRIGELRRMMAGQATSLRDRIEPYLGKALNVNNRSMYNAVI